MEALKEKAFRLLRAKLFDSLKQGGRVFCYTGEEILAHLGEEGMYPRQIIEREVKA